MGFNSKASLIVGISMSKLFTELKEVSDTFDEFDKYGKKTGKQFKEEKLIATLPNGTDVIISEDHTNFGWNYDFYNSIGFDDQTYVGDVFNVTITIHHANYENKNLNQIIIGLEVCETEWSNGGSDHVVKVDEYVTNVAIDRVRKQLTEVFGYTGEINLYLSNNLSY